MMERSWSLLLGRCGFACPVHQRDVEAEPLLWVEDELIDASGSLCGIAFAGVVLELDAESAVEHPRARRVDIENLPYQRADLSGAVLRESRPESARTADWCNEFDMAVEVGRRQDRPALDRVRFR